MKNEINRMVGFSLIELMVVIAIIAILTAVIAPTFQQQLREVRRSDGQTKLMEVQANMERYIFDNAAYPTGLAQMSAYSTNVVDSEEEHYKVSIKTAAGCAATSCYQLQAIAQGGQAEDGDLELHSNGTKVGNW